MGRAKTALIESEERGWDAPEKFVCAECVEDEFLKECIQRNLDCLKCDYCGQESDNPISTLVQHILEPISGALFHYFAEPAGAGVPRDDGEWVGNMFDTFDVLESLPFYCNEESLFQDIVNSFHDWWWVECADGHWLGEHESTRWIWDWKFFENTIKTKTRYFFSDVSDELSSFERGSSPIILLNQIGRMAERLGLYKCLPAETCLYRVRTTSGDKTFDSFDEMGPPPSCKARSGRMNPIGISYFYLACEKETAIEEALNHSSCRGFIATFKPKQNLTILDLATLPNPPSVFDVDRYKDRQAILFLSEFVHAISQPTNMKSNGEDIHYLPSQVVSEYFAQVCSTNREHGQIDGIVYPSTKESGGKNVVIFPPRQHFTKWTDIVEICDIEQVN
ncbi:MAG: RES domain-containing protein [Gammaproteobacteria bacterium]|nr:RES domain-containing protein [Gammaproteobacteria bacterium]